MSTLASAIQRGTRGAQPAATAVSSGTIYCVTDEGNILERSSGAAWQAYSPTGTGAGTVTNTGTLASGAIVKGNGGVDVSTTTTGTGILTALGINVGSAGAPVTFNGALGTPASGTLTNCTGLPTTGLGAGGVVQVVNTQSGAVATGTTVLPIDDTPPQKTEGDEYMTLAVTPTNASNKLRIDVVVTISNSAAGGYISAALFQDTTSDALAATTAWQASANGTMNLKFTHYMAAGTTSATTFKVRAGSGTAGTSTFNGIAAARYFGGVMASSITITEIKV